jgi:hypothetical protein
MFFMAATAAPLGTHSVENRRQRWGGIRIKAPRQDKEDDGIDGENLGSDLLII